MPKDSLRKDSDRNVAEALAILAQLHALVVEYTHTLEESRGRLRESWKILADNSERELSRERLLIGGAVVGPSRRP